VTQCRHGDTDRLYRGDISGRPLPLGTVYRVIGVKQEMLRCTVLHSGSMTGVQ
jgi:uncharacterized protein (UPF0179 family)